MSTAFVITSSICVTGDYFNVDMLATIIIFNILGVYLLLV